MAQYLKPDSELGYIEDNAEIEKLKIDNLRHVALGCMLGDFNDVGDYVIASDVVAELISMEKYFVQAYDNIELCKSALKLDKQISFMVTYEGNRATLSLVEKINFEGNFLLNSGTYSNINEYVLDTVETSGEVNRNMIYMRWNIKTMPSQIIDIFNCEGSVLEKYFGIVNRFKYLLHSNRIILQKESQVEEIEAEYLNSILTSLSHYPKLEKEVLATIKETLTEKKGAISVKKPFFVKTLNEVVENAISHNINVLETKQLEEFNVERRNAIVNLNVKRDIAFDVENVSLQSNDDEIVPQVIQFKKPNNYLIRPLEEIAKEFVAEHKKVEGKTLDDAVDSDLFRRTILAIGERNGVEIVLPAENKSKQLQGEKSDLINKLHGLGCAELLDIEIPKTTTDNVQDKVEIVTPPSDKKPQSNNQKKATNNKTNSNKPDKNNSKGGKSGSVKPKSEKPTKVKPAEKGKEGAEDKNTTGEVHYDYILGYGFSNSSVDEKQTEPENKESDDENKKEETKPLTKKELEAENRKKVEEDSVNVKGAMVDRLNRILEGSVVAEQIKAVDTINAEGEIAGAINPEAVTYDESKAVSNNRVDNQPANSEHDNTV